MWSFMSKLSKTVFGSKKISITTPGFFLDSKPADTWWQIFRFAEFFSDCLYWIFLKVEKIFRFAEFFNNLLYWVYLKSWVIFRDLSYFLPEFFWWAFKKKPDYFSLNFAAVWNLILSLKILYDWFLDQIAPIIDGWLEGVGFRWYNLSIYSI